MTKEDIIRMAMESGITKVMDESSYRWLLEGREPINEVFIKFANLVAAAERQHIHEYLMRLHMDAGGKHNYLHVAAVGLEDL